MLFIKEELLPYHNSLRTRNTEDLRFIVIHCTELPSLQMAREYGERIIYPENETGVSGHYYIDKDGSVYRYVSDDRIAHHVLGHNDRSIGVELVNRGRFPHWYSSRHQQCVEPYAAEQISSLKELLSELKRKYPQISDLARHSDLDTQMIPAEDKPEVQIRRKIDPGPLFPWEEILTWWRSFKN